MAGQLPCPRPMVAADWFLLAVWPPHGPFSTPQSSDDAIVWKLAVVVASWVLLAGVAWRTDLDEDQSAPKPGRVVDTRYRRGREW